MLESILMRVLRDGTAVPLSNRIALIGRDGREIAMQKSAAPILDNAGKMIGEVLVFHDVSWQREAEEALAASERVYRAIGESIDYGVWVCDPDGRNTYASESFLKLVGRAQQECSGFGWIEVLHPDDAERTMSAWKEWVRTEGRWENEYRFRGLDGEWHPMLSRGGPVRDERGRITCWAGINLDISALRRAQEQTIRASALMEGFFSTCPGILNIVDENLRYLNTDPLTPTYFGLTREQLVGKSVPELAPEFMHQYGPMLREVMRTGQPRLNVEVRAAVPALNGEMVHWLTSYFPLRLPDGKRGLGVVGVEITPLKNIEERLRKAQQLEAIGRWPAAWSMISTTS